MSERKFIVPEYGPFAGMRVVCSGSLVAMPFAATMLADFGAEVIQIERPGVGDTLRMLAPFADVNGTKVSTAWAQNARNKFAMGLELNLKHEEVKEIFYGLIKEADIFMETWFGLISSAFMMKSCSRSTPSSLSSTSAAWVIRNSAAFPLFATALPMT